MASEVIRTVAFRRALPVRERLAETTLDIVRRLPSSSAFRNILDDLAGLAPMHSHIVL